jgi:hypothetical protein
MVSYIYLEHVHRHCVFWAFTYVYHIQHRVLIIQNPFPICKDAKLNCNYKLRDYLNDMTWAN